MGLGFNLESGGNGDITPFVKYDAKAGRLFRNDRSQDSSGAYSSAPVDITRSFKAVMDLENLEVGWVLYAPGAAPMMHLAKAGGAYPDKPSTPDGFKKGARIIMRLGKDCGNDIRELAGNSRAFLTALEKLYAAYEAGAKENPGRLPIVILKDTSPVTSGSGATKTTNYEPLWEIVGWSDRPSDLTPRLKGSSAPAPAAASTTAAPTSASTASRATPPETGSTRVSPPGATTAPAAAQPAMAEADSDFG